MQRASGKTNWEVHSKYHGKAILARKKLCRGSVQVDREPGTEGDTGDSLLVLICEKPIDTFFDDFPLDDRNNGLMVDVQRLMSTYIFHC